MALLEYHDDFDLDQSRLIRRTTSLMSINSLNIVSRETGMGASRSTAGSPI
jgi:hypothetical protein